MNLLLAATPRFVGTDGRSAALGPRDAALLAWLAIEGPTPRQRLAAMIWPDSPPEAARNALRQRLFQLRRQLGIDLVEGRHELALAPGIVHDLADADEILGGAQGAIGAEFDGWLDRVRAARTQAQLSRLRHTFDAAERELDTETMLHTAQRLLALDPLSEEAHRRLMRAHYLRGDRAAALRVFDACEQTLRREVGAAPSAETLALLATIDAAQPAGLPATAQAMPAGLLLPPRLIGRDAERAQLDRAWAGGQVVALIGEAGLGKTRLLQAMARERIHVVGASGRPGDAGVPFATLARVLRAVLQREHAAAFDQRLPADTRHGIARVLPEFDAAPAARLPGRQAGLAGEGGRLQMERALRALLQAQTGLEGIWVDDLHFADEASLEMLRALVDEDAELGADGAPRLRWLFTYRPAEAGTPVQALHDGLVEHARLTPIPLRPLDEAGLAALVDSLGLPGIDGAALAPALARRTGGNPLFVLETLKQAWAERKLAQLADAASLPRPVSVGRLIERRIAQLSPPALALARVASVAGTDFSIAMAEQVLQAPAITFADALNELERAHVMRGSAFAHDLVFDAVQASVPAPIAAHLHACVAGFLEPRGAEAARIAAHWIAAEQPLRALPWLEQAADKARRALRMKEYIAFYEQKSVIEAAAGRFEAAFESLILAAEEFSRVDRDPETGLRYCARLEQLATTPAQRIDALLQRANFEVEAVHTGQSVEHARQALRESHQLGDPRRTALSRLQLAASLTTADQLAEAAEHYRACMDWVEAHGTLDQRCELHGAYGVLCDNLGRLAEGMVHHERCVHFARQSGNLSSSTVGLSNLACNRIDAGDIVAAREHLLQALQISGLHDEFSAGIGSQHAMLALTALTLGHYDEALERAQRAIDAMARYTGSYSEAAALRQAQIWQHLGQWARVQRVLERPDVRGSTRAASQIQAAMLQHHLDVALGRAPGDGLARALELLQENERPDLRLPLRIDRAALLPTAQALAELEQVIAAASAIQHHGTVLAAHVRAAGLAADTQPDRACSHAEAALALSSTVHSTLLQPGELWRDCGRALLSRGDDVRAREVFGAGRDWLHRTARDHVPAPFRVSFLERQPVARELLRLAAKASS